MDLKNKIIVVTGGNGLLGKAIVSYLENSGANTIVADITIDTNNKNHIYLDITNESSVEKLIADVVEKHKHIDGWVNNAYPRTKDWDAKPEDVKFESWRKNIDMHLNGYFLCSQRVLEQMKKQNSGSLVNMASVYGIVGADFSVYEGTEMTNPVAYSAIKGGLINLTKYLASYSL
mgnify:CR=1 FL=1